MGRRRQARELAMQALFFLDTVSGPQDQALELFAGIFPPPQSLEPFFFKVTRGVIDCREEIDALLTRFSSHWKVFRMSGVDRNIMRVAVYEMLHCGDVPRQVSINEAIEIGKKYGSEESGAFINGVLDGINKHLEENEKAP